MASESAGSAGWRRTPTPLWLGVAALIGLGLAVLFRFDPSRYPFYPRCLFHEVTGLHCPGCGATRALHQLLHGRVVEAMGLNAMLVAALPYLGYVAASELYRRGTGRSLPRLFVSAWSVWALFV